MARAGARGVRRARGRGGRRRALPPGRAAGGARARARRRVRGAEWPSPLSRRPRAHARRSTRCASWRATTRWSRCGTRSSTTCETPVSAYLKLRGDGPVVPARVGRAGPALRPLVVPRLPPARGDPADGGGSTSTASRASSTTRTRRSAEELARYRIAPLDGPAAVRRRRGRACSATTSCAPPSRPSASRNPDDVGMPDLALMVSDVLVAFDHLRHEVTILANVLRASERRRARLRARPRRRSPTCASGWPRPVPRVRPRARASRREFDVEHRRRRLRARRSSAPRSTSAPATSTRSCRASAGAPTARSRRSRSTAACARSTRARTCTSSTSRTSRSRARRPSRW